jgi:hypothetical protein
MAAGGVSQNWYPSSHSSVPVSTTEHSPEHTQPPPDNIQEHPAVQPNNNINVAGRAFFTRSGCAENVQSLQMKAESTHTISVNRVYN